MGIKQWPHRKLKAVEKRLALQQAEKRYLTETDSQDKFDKQIRELEEKRQNLLQVMDGSSEQFFLSGIFFFCLFCLGYIFCLGQIQHL